MKKAFTPLAILFFALVGISSQSLAQENAAPFSVGAEIVSSYVWRGLQFDATPNIQPYSEFAVGNFVLGAWGSYNFTGTYQESDIYLAYRKYNFSVTLLDYFSGHQDYFNFDNDSTKHLLELLVAAKISEQIPITVTGSLFFAGADKKAGSTDNNYSMYFELAYDKAWGATNFKTFLGIVPTESPYYATDGFGVINLGCKISRQIAITDKFSLPIQMSIVSNPDAEHMFFFFGFSL